MIKRIFNNVISFGKKVAKNIPVLFIVGGVAMTFSLASCDKNDGSVDSFVNRSTIAADYPQSSLPVVTVSGDITTNTTWTAGNVYEISGVVTVRNNATLTISPGTFIKASINTPGAQNGVLVIAKDGKINAVGEECNPIVFTSRYLLDANNNTVGKSGDFGGVIILGNATINTASGTANIEGLPSTDPRYSFGGSNDADDRGAFEYVRIEYAGYQLATDIEVNGLTIGGVGSETDINNVEVAWGLDDGFEWFGGTVSCANLLSYANDDDQFDYDLGYRGTLSNSVAIANDASTHSGGVNPDSNGAEIDNSSMNPCGATPRTEVIFDNVRIWGTTSGSNANLYKYGVRIRRGASLIATGSTVTGYNTGLFTDSPAPVGCDEALVDNSRIHGYVSIGNFTDDGGNTMSTSSPAPWFPGSFAACWAKFDY
ncbi:MULTISPECIES: hypothetical protein [Sphingobacterium]|uniref:hypothetical protein n=1 Tax=Sphingobacterium TaxID=28453 RepID=UPI0013DB3B35|nr:MULTISPECIES: hypothetical protein [unclassified Sphingobacterium]